MANTVADQFVATPAAAGGQGDLRRRRRQPTKPRQLAETAARLCRLLRAQVAREGPQVRSLHRPPYSPSKPGRFPGRQKPPQFRRVSEAQRGLRTEFRLFSRILRLK